jgi:hypothetical protein
MKCPNQGRLDKLQTGQLFETPNIEESRKGWLIFPILYQINRVCKFLHCFTSIIISGLFLFGLQLYFLGLAQNCLKKYLGRTMEHDLQNDCQEKLVLSVLPEVTPLLNVQEVSLFEQYFGIHTVDT